MTDNNGNIKIGWLKAISISSITASIVLIASICIFFYATCWKFEANQNYMSSRSSALSDSLVCELYSIEPAADSIENNPEIMHKLLKNQKAIIEQQKELILDIRQETNNNIDKITLWLSFWIGIIALFGVCAPAIAEYRFRIVNERELNDIKNKCDAYLNNLQASIELSDERLKALDEKLAELKLHEYINTLTLSWENNIIDKLPGSRKELERVVHNLKEGLYRITHNSSIIDNPTKCSEILHPVVLRIYDFFCRESNAIHKFTTSRVMDKTKDNLRHAIQLTANPSADDIPQIKEVLDRIIYSLKRIFEE